MLQCNKSGPIQRYLTARDQENIMYTATLRYPGPLGEAESTPKTASPKTALPKTAAASRKGRFARFYDALIEARMRQAMRELALHHHLMPENSITIDR